MVTNNVRRRKASPAQARQSETQLPQPRQDNPVTGPQPTPKLPHERDESAESQSGPPRRTIRLAQRDNETGVLDTDRRSAYGLADGLPRARKTTG